MAGVDRAWSLWFERGYPAALGISAFVASTAWSPRAFALATEEGWHLEQLYGGVFNLAAVLTGFLFTFYSFVVTTDRGFLGSSKTSIHYVRANGYTLAAVRLGGLLTVLSIPIMVWQPSIGENVAVRIVIGSWVGLVVWTLFAFERATRIFAIFARSHEQLAQRPT